jgi:uncharacterized phage-associated protein
MRPLSRFFKMNFSETYTQNQIDKLGNTLVFLCNKMEGITKTHLLKLVFIIEEISVKKYGIPFFGLRFDVWKLGPVSKDLYVELSDELNLLSPYITKETKNGVAYVIPVKEFCDDEFSDNEINLLNEITDRFLYCTAKELIHFTHRKHTPWYNTALKYGVLDLLESGKMNVTNYEIMLQDTIEDDAGKLALFYSHQEFIRQSQSLKS